MKHKENFVFPNLVDELKKNLEIQRKFKKSYVETSFGVGKFFDPGTRTFDPALRNFPNLIISNCVCSIVDGREMFGEDAPYLAFSINTHSQSRDFALLMALKDELGFEVENDDKLYTFSINFGEDFEKAARIYTRVVCEVYGIFEFDEFFTTKIGSKKEKIKILNDM